MDDENAERYWETGWQGHERAQLRRMARWPLWEKIRWLEQAAELVNSLERLKKRSNTPDSDNTSTESR